ncbi:hypothetical protein CVT25_005503 [Psilocybe cyanescens]|uniref:Uncharacterized protein n=1 Tax=Psilocybe cyanescens TaxID=93625 RepID=A0A409X6B5_PSICY|nr:hypothetical protein CVT25_005503 [Psilocybe cyanescens]
MVIHVPGTTRPGAPKQAEYIKTDLYFPGHLAREDKRYAEAVSSIVQTFITEIGIPNIAHYKRCATLHWKLPQGNHIPPALPQQSS